MYELSYNTLIDMTMKVSLNIKTASPVVYMSGCSDIVEYHCGIAYRAG